MSTRSFGRMKPPAPLSGGNVGRDRAQAGRQDRGHEAGALALDQLGLADRFAHHKGGARERAGQLFGGIVGRSFFLMKVGLAAAAGHSCQCRSFAATVCPIGDLGLRDQHLIGFDLGRRFGVGARRLVGAARQRMAARPPAARATPRITDARLHTLHFPHDAAAITHRSRGLPAGKGQSMVNQAYLNRVNEILLRDTRQIACFRYPPNAFIHTVC